MTQTLLTLGKNEDRVVNLVKANFGLSNKNDAVRLIINTYEDELMQKPFKPAYAKKLKRLMKERNGPVFRSIEDFDKYFA